MAFEPLHRGRCELAVGKSRTAPRLDEVVDKRGDVAPAVAQRRQRDWNDVEAVEKILAEPAIGNERPHVAVRRRDDAHVGAERLIAADGRIFVALKHAEQPRLRRSEEHTSELQSLMRNSYAVFCLKKKNQLRP